MCLLSASFLTYRKTSASSVLTWTSQALIMSALMERRAPKDLFCMITVKDISERYIYYIIIEIINLYQSSIIKYRNIQSLAVLVTHSISFLLFDFIIRRTGLLIFLCSELFSLS